MAAGRRGVEGGRERETRLGEGMGKFGRVSCGEGGVLSCLRLVGCRVDRGSFDELREDGWVVGGGP
jgi:hypothetical protein